LSVHAVLLAAGNSSRYGGPKLLATIDGVSLIRRAAQAALATGAPLLVVTGAYADRIGAEIADLDARIVHNGAWADGMGGSIACAFRQLVAETDAAAAILCPADLPRVGPAQLQRLIDAHCAAPQRIVVSQFGAAQGPPCVFPRRCFAELAQLSGPQGARAVLARHADEITHIPMPEAAADIDTPDDLAKLRAT
jgi:molybdenum cofactor cytidylyltransferase